MARDLARHGCIPRKSLILKFPTTVPENMMHHMLRGYFDGDSCVYLRTEAKLINVHILGTKEFLEGHAKYITTPFTLKQRHNNTVWYLGISKERDALIFRDWLYKDATLYMKRKRDKFYSKNVTSVNSVTPYTILRDIITTILIKNNRIMSRTEIFNEVNKIQDISKITSGIKYINKIILFTNNNIRNIPNKGYIYNANYTRIAKKPKPI